MRCVWCLLVFGLAACRGPTLAERSLLAFSGTISGRSHQSFDIAGSQGEVLRVVLQQAGLDLDIEIVDSQRAKLGRFESNTGRYGEDSAVVTLPRSATYTVVVGTDRLPKVTAPFKLTITANGPLSAADRLYATASNIASDTRPVDRISQFEDAAAQFDKAGRSRAAGLAALAGATVTMYRVSDAQRLVRLSEQAVSAFEKANEPALLAASLNLLGSAQATALNAAKDVVEENFTRALERYESVDSKVGAAEVHLYRGVARYGLIANAAVDYPLILADWKTAADQCSAVHETLCEARAATNLGVYYRDERQTDLAVEYLYRAVSVAQDGSDPLLFAGASDNLAFALQSIGEFDAAMYHHRRALQAFARDGECSGALRSLYGIGHSLLGVGDIEQATRLYQLARQASCRTGIAPDAAILATAATTALSIEQMCDDNTVTAQRDPDEAKIASWIAWDLGTLARSQGKLQAALACHELALKLAPTVNSRFTARLESVVDVLDAGDSNAARKRFAALEPAAKEASSWYHPRTLDVSAQLQRAAGELARAHETFRQAAAAYTASKQLEAQFETLGNLAAVKLEAGDLAAAADYFAQADGALEQLRIGSADPIYRATLLASRRGVYENWLRGLTGRAAAAGDLQRRDMDSLVISERSRQRVLADLLNQYQVGRATHAARMQFAISEQNADLLKTPAADPRPEDSRDAFQSLDELRHSVGAVEAFDGAAQRKAADALRVWQASLPADICVIEFMLGEQASYAWLMRRNSLTRVTLEPAAKIRAAAADVRPLLATDAPLATLRAASARLHSLVVAPLELRDSDTQLTIVADDILNEIPFAALWDSQRNKYLIEMHAIRYSPSLHFAATRALESRQAPLTRALLIGDAAYEADDAQARCGTTVEASDRTTADTQGLRRIRGSGREVEQIAALFLKADSSTDALVGCAATRSNVLGRQLEDYRYIHFATHATADASLPLRSAIHLAAFDERGRRVEAELRARDLFARRFNAELVVLSGCSTASGRTFSGEGTLGLSFAMLAGGSRNVISALWPVADAASVPLVVKLYEEMIVEKRPVAEALQAAQLSLLKDARWNRPRYWGPYLLIGS